MTTVGLLGDHFVTPELMEQALRAALPEHPWDLRSSRSSWPMTPFGNVAEVQEACGTEEETIAAIDDAEVVVTQMAPITRRVLETSKNLRLVCVARGGPVNVNLEAAADHGVEVRPAPSRNATATAEHTVALILACARRIPARHQEMLDGQWRSDYYALEQCGPEVGASVVGLVGYGAVGAQVAGIVRAMGARVLVYDPYAAADSIHPDDLQVDSLDELMMRATIVSLHARLTSENHAMIGAPQIAAMAPGSILVNAARGPLLDYDATAAALHTGHLFAAGFDVYPVEPADPSASIFSAPNVVFTPHLAGATRRTAEFASQLCAANVVEWVAATGR